MSPLAAFAAIAVVPVAGGLSSVSITPVRPAPPAAVGPVLYMRSRRDLKKEKFLRNLEYARQHRKRAPSRFNRRAQQLQDANSDNQYLSSIYGTISFGNHSDGKESK